MRILTRHLLKAHFGPFLFAFSALTGLLFLNAVAQRLQDLAGKGLTWPVIGDFLVLSLPHTIALTLPMAVLVAVLYAFSDLTASNELTAMKAGGVHPRSILVPLLLWGAVMAAIMFYFNNSVLPEANHQLKDLLVDISRKSPTFELREQVVNEIATGQGQAHVFLTAREIDQAKNELQDVVIYDPTDPDAHRTTYAERGSMAFNRARTDLYLTLYDGVTYETEKDQEGGFQQVRFARQIVPLRGVGNELDRRVGANDRGDREMSIAMLKDRIATAGAELKKMDDQVHDKSRQAVLLALGRTEGVDSSQVLLLGRRQGNGPMSSSRRTPLSRDDVTRETALSVRSAATRAHSIQLSIDQKRVEIHKKFTLAFACIVFVLIGAPLAIRFPRGGLGLTIAASSLIFAVYWVGLIGGENLADRGLVSPALIMWLPNAVFLAIGLWMVARMGKETATNRGGGWDDLLYSLGRPFRRLRKARA